MVTTGPWLLYGANGYTGALIARLAAERGHRPVLAGRRAGAICELADTLGLERRLFALDDPQRLDAALEGMTAVLHCAGPFSRTARPMAEACVRTRTHYLDITGEVEVFEALAACDAQARERGVMLLPGCGFDVVPSDCLAAHLHRRQPSAVQLALAYASAGRLSRGTALTALEGLGQPGLVRRGGVLTPVPSGQLRRRIDFGEGPRLALGIPLGDLATAWRSTGIPDIELYLAASLPLRALASAGRWLGPALGSPTVKGLLARRVRAGQPGPSDDERARGRAFVWGEAKDAGGRRVEARLETPDGYTFTARAALAIVERVLAGDAKAGYATPALAYGADFVLGIEGVRRFDVA